MMLLIWAAGLACVYLVIRFSLPADIRENIEACKGPRLDSLDTPHDQKGMGR